MGMSKEIYIGPAIRVEVVTQTILKSRKGCINESCSHYKSYVQGHFCHQCGEEYGLISIRQEVESDMLENIDDYYSDLMCCFNYYRPIVEGDRKFHIYIPNYKFSDQEINVSAEDDIFYQGIDSNLIQKLMNDFNNHPHTKEVLEKYCELTQYDKAIDARFSVFTYYI